MSGPTVEPPPNKPTHAPSATSMIYRLTMMVSPSLMKEGTGNVLPLSSVANLPACMTSVGAARQLNAQLLTHMHTAHLSFALRQCNETRMVTIRRGVSPSLRRMRACTHIHTIKGNHDARNALGWLEEDRFACADIRSIWLNRDKRYVQAS